MQWIFGGKGVVARPSQQAVKKKKKKKEQIENDSVRR